MFPCKSFVLYAILYISICNYNVVSGLTDLGFGYILSDYTSANQANATIWCQEQGKSLISIETPVEDELILGLLRAGATDKDWIYTSGSNSIGRFNWRWDSTGAPLYHTRWRTTFPGSDSNTLCLKLATDSLDRGWYSADCSTGGYPLCEDSI